MTKYYREIDSLRALAVIAVIINHFEKSWLTGGFLGVDIFFVISGFVVTASLRGREEDSLGSFLKRFYKRRIKRLYPALVSCIFLFSIPIFLFFSVNDVYIKTGFNALFGLSNFYLLREASDYFSISSESNPFTHTWSLGVEEQFYLFFPLLYFLGKRKKMLTTLLIFGVCLSGALFLYWYQKDPLLSFYMMPTRFWQFSLGALAYLFSFEKIFEKFNPHLILIPLVGIFITLFLTQEFNFSSAFLVSVFTALCLVFIKGGQERKYLLYSPVLKTGLASYSLYLYHWPVLILFKQTVSLEKFNAFWALIIIVLLSFLSYSFLEQYFRKNTWYKKEKIIFFSILFLAMTFKFDSKKYHNLLYMGGAKEAYSFYDSEEFNVSLLKKCTYRSGNKFIIPSEKEFLNIYLEKCNILKGNEKSLYIFGNSHAQEKAPTFIKLAKEHDFNLYYFTKSGVFIYPHKIENEQEYLSKNMTKLFFSSLDKKAKAGDVVIISIALFLFTAEKKFYFEDKKINGEEAFYIFQGFLKEKTKEFAKKGVKIYFTDGYPVLHDSIVPVNCYQDWSYKSPHCDIQAVISKDLTNIIRKWDQVLKNDKDINYISLFEALENAYEKVERPLRLYRDSGHLSRFGNEFIYPYIEKAIMQKE